MPRQEFTKPVKLEITLRATDSNGIVRCEGCGLVLGKKPFQIDHTLADGLQDPKHKKKLTADDGKLLGQECCHSIKTKTDVAMIAKAKRAANRNAGITAPKGNIQSQGFAKSQKPKALHTQAGLEPLPPRGMFR